ncbi:sensor histidine kinase [Nocardia sp. NPDC056064]|uniref:sensor histidine kinase n=1 Tax=Nocardia sp. NPDC056064 TaxID=3345701 RepID=UPI0035E1B0AA
MNSSEGSERTAARLDSGGSSAFAERFAARVPELVDRYRAGLNKIASPLTDAEAWDQCAVQARRIFDDCVRSLAFGEPTVGHIADVYDLGSERVRQGGHPAHSVRAGNILAELGTRALAECAQQVGAPQSELVAAVLALQRGIGLRLEAGAIGYDAFLLQRVREVHELGQRRLAREIHDHIGSSAGLALRRLELYEVECEQAGNGAGSRHVRLAKAAIVETLTHSRELAGELRTPSVSGSLETALRGFAASLGTAGAPMRIRVHGDDGSIPADIVEELFVMVRECLRNSVDHSGASDVDVHLHLAPHEVLAEIIDNGTGFDVDAPPTGGSGLLILRERCELVGGTVNIDSVPGSGTHVTLCIPIPREPQ